MEQEGLDVFDSVGRFEEALNELVESISRFQPSNNVADKLIVANSSLLSSIETLKVHQEYGQKINALKAQSDGLDKQLNNLLIGLSDCRRELMALPSADEESEREENKVNAAELLKYATKITKFTHAPPRYNPQMPEHANFPWPTEDELRRGVLALNAVTEEDTALQQNDTQPLERRGSDVNYGEPEQSQPRTEQAPKVLDLDLFDPDDDD